MTGNHQMLAMVLFSAFVAVTLAITTWVSRHRQGSAEEFYAGGELTARRCGGGSTALSSALSSRAKRGIFPNGSDHRPEDPSLRSG